MEYKAQYQEYLRQPTRTFIIMMVICSTIT